MTVIEWIDTPEGRRYRAWNTTADCYVGPEVDRAGMLRALVRGGHTEESAESTLAKIDATISKDGLSHGRVDRWSVEYDSYGDPIVPKEHAQ